MRYKQYHAITEDGWSTWIQPNEDRYFLKCCDCGLAHEMQFVAAPKNTSEGDEMLAARHERGTAHRVYFRVRRIESRRKALRKKRAK